MRAVLFDRVSKHYAGAPSAAVDDVSMEIPAGQTTVIVGASGSGKTTLLKMVNRLLEPTSGRILVDGRDTRSIPPNELRRGIGYVIQQIGLFPHWTVYQNVATVPSALGWSKGRIADRVDELLGLVGLPPAEFRQRYPSQLSGGQQQRVGIARALAADPGIMLMDEPFGAVDAITRARLQEEFRALQERTRKTVLFVTHDVEEALKLADGVIVMEKGRLVQHDTPFDIVARPASAYVAELIGSEDTLRLLGLIDVRSVVEPLSPGAADCQGEPVSVDSSIRTVLNRLLQSGCDTLPAVDGEGNVFGQVTLESVRRQLRRAGISPAPMQPRGMT